MADLGSIGKLYGGLDDYKLKRHPASWWRGYDGETTRTFTYDISGSLSGIVKRGGTPASNIWVRLYYRPTGVLIAQTKSANDGTFSFSPSNDIPIGLDVSDSSNYYALAVDDRNLENFIICDLLTAV